MTIPRLPPRPRLPAVRPPAYSGPFPARTATPAEPFELSVLALTDSDIIAVDDSDERPTLVPGR